MPRGGDEELGQMPPPGSLPSNTSAVLLLISEENVHMLVL